MHSLTAFIPMDRRQALARGDSLPDRTSGAALFADISGFTPLTNALVEELGPQRGPEELTRQLNRIYSALIAEVHRYRGSVIGFSGDAIMCWFEGQPAATSRATACALEMQQVLGRLGDGVTPLGTAVPLAVKVAVTAGTGRRFLVGDPAVQQIEVVAGEVVNRAAAAEKVLQRGEVAVGAEILSRFGDQAAAQEWRVDDQGEYFAIVEGLAQPVPAAPWPQVAEPAEAVVHNWVLKPVVERWRQGHFSIAQLRLCVPLFLKFSGINYEADDQAGQKLDSYIRWVQGIMARYEGHLIQLTLGDKGSYLYAVFGALLSHEDNAARAVATALELQKATGEFPFITARQIGLSQGQLYTGTSGSPDQYTFCALGSEVNIAARLMSKAEAGQILATPHIIKSATQYHFQPLGAIPVKGLAKPLPVFAVQEGEQRTVAAAAERRRLPMVGRKAELEILLDQLAGLAQGQSSLVTIEGDAGIGKSRLVAEWLARAGDYPIRTLVASADAVESNTLYYLWRPIFRRLFERELGLETSGERQAAVLAQMETMFGPDDPERALAPLLNGILSLDLPETALTKSLQGEGRANKTNDLFSRILQIVAGERPLLIVLEDAQWMDASSWELARLVGLDVKPLLLAIVTRPMLEPLPQAYHRLLRRPHRIHLTLDNLSPEETLQLVCSRLGVSRLPDSLAELIRQRAEGPPFFSEDLVYGLRDAGVIDVKDGKCTIADGVDLQTAMLPTTVQAMIASRIDRLSQDEQLILKVASVIGRVFAQKTLLDVHPLRTEAELVNKYLDHLARLDLTPLESLEPEVQYIFKHIITQEVAYGLMLYTQRQELHRAVAECYEATYAADLHPPYPLLAYHWQKAEAADK
ncbi:MAG: AAA family ATPase, partial [Chloroflexi bacterium]|nr:AAA family ATPase [Chloroflexota bacterium]